MIISQIVKFCCIQPKNVSCNSSNLKLAAFILDCITAVALIVIGSLAISGVISLSPAASWAIFGAGVVYTVMMALEIFGRRQIHIS